MLAQLAIEEGHSAAAQRPLREGLEIFRQQKLRDDELAAHVMLARALLSVGKRAEAQKEIDFALAPPGAAVRRAASSRRPADFAEAAKNLNVALAAARQYGHIGYQLEAGLALGEIEMKSGHVSAGRALLRALEKEAKDKGFGLITRKAAAIMAELEQG